MRINSKLGVILVVIAVLLSGCPSIKKPDLPKPLFQCDELSAQLANAPSLIIPEELNAYYRILIEMSIPELEKMLEELEYCRENLREKYKAGEVPEDYYSKVSLQYDAEIVLIKLALEYLKGQLSKETTEQG